MAADLDNLAVLLQDTNRPARRSRFRRALAIFEESSGRIIPEWRTGLNNLARLLQGTNRLSEAEPLYRRALAIDEASYGPDHPRVAIDLANLAGIAAQDGSPCRGRTAVTPCAGHFR